MSIKYVRRKNTPEGVCLGMRDKKCVRLISHGMDTFCAWRETLVALRLLLVVVGCDWKICRRKRENEKSHRKKKHKKVALAPYARVGAKINFKFAFTQWESCLFYCAPRSAVKRYGNLWGIYVSFLVIGRQTEHSTLVRLVSRDAKINFKFAFTQWKSFFILLCPTLRGKTLW